MAYELHIVRTKDWLQAVTVPITKADVDALLVADPELAWSTSDYVGMSDASGVATRYDMILWNGEPCFWWHKDEITCSGPNEKQQLKLSRIARALNAYVVGDDGERYELRKNFLGREKLALIATGA